MSEQLVLSAEARERAGKGASRAIRREGRVPAVIYGDKQDPVSVHVEEKALIKALSNGHFMNTIVMVEVEGNQTRTLPRDVQFHPVTDRPLHVDFLRIAKNATVHVNVPVRFVNEDEAPGLSRGGVLNIVRHELELVCDASRIPDEIVIDLTGYELGDSIHLSAVTLPEGSRSSIEDRDFTIATVVAPSAYTQTEEEPAAEGAEAPAEEAPAEEAPDVGEDG
jgi:large subunit ribosomal protein L25